MPKDMDRRDFLKSIAASGTVAMTAWPALATASAATASSTYKVFTVPQAALVGAIANQFIPPDDYPGATDAGVVHYIDGFLAGHYGNFYRERYEVGLKAIDETSHKQFGTTFASLSSEHQTAILKHLEAGADDNPSGHAFFRLILQHTLEGYYGDPEHGGNRNGASWKMIGFGG
jgi:gluconate 2-dehydrogenase gamma chain